MKEIVSEDEVVFYESDNVNSLNEKIKSSSNKEEKYINKAKNAYKKVKTQTYEIRCKSILDYFD